MLIHYSSVISIPAQWRQGEGFGSESLHPYEPDGRLTRAGSGHDRPQLFTLGVFIGRWGVGGVDGFFLRGFLVLLVVQITVGRAGDSR